MDYIEAFKNLKTNNKYSRKSPHKAILLLTVIEMYETNALSENVILYNEELKCTFQKVWERTLKDEPLFHPEVYFPFWYMQSEDFWHIVPIRGREDILTLLRDSHVKPSEAKLKECVKYAELDEDLYFLMTLPSGRSSLKKVLLETYTNLSESQIDHLSESVDNYIDYSVSAVTEYEKILSQEKNESKKEVKETSNELVQQFQKIKEDIQIELNLQYFSFLKSHRNEREMFKEICPTVFDLLDKIINHPVKQGDISPSFAFTYDNFLSDLKISLMTEEGAMEIIDKIEEAINALRGTSVVEEHIAPVKDEKTSPKQFDNKTQIETSNNTTPLTNDTEVEHVFLDSHRNVIDKITPPSDIIPERDFSIENRKGKPCTIEEENKIQRYYLLGTDIKTIADIIGRTEVSIKSRLAKLGLIDYSYEQDNNSSVKVSDTVLEKTDEGDFTIKNSLTRCSIVNKKGDTVFSAEGKLKYISGRLYRLNLKTQCFTLKSMSFDGSLWLRGDKKIVAYSQTKLYGVLENAMDYIDEVEDIVDSSIFENCKLKVSGDWYNYNGDLINNTPIQNENQDDNSKQNSDKTKVIRSPLYAVRKQAILRAMYFFKNPKSIRDISRTISRTAWGATIKENDVEEIINTISEVECVDGKYILRKK